MEKDANEKRPLIKGPALAGAIILGAFIGALIAGLSIYLVTRNLEQVETEASPEPGNRHEFEKITIEGLNFASGLVRVYGRTFWTVTDKGDTLVLFDAEKGLRRIIEVRPPRDVAEALDYPPEKFDLEGITYDPERGVFYVVTEANRAVMTVAADGTITRGFFVEGADAADNIGLEGISFDAERDLIYVVDEGPYDRPKKLYQYDIHGNKTGGPFEIIIYKRITGITHTGGGRFLALNTFKSGEEGFHRVITFSIEDPVVKELIDVQNEYPGFKNDAKGFETNYEGIDVDEDGNIYLINDARTGDATNLLVIFKKD